MSTLRAGVFGTEPELLDAVQRCHRHGHCRFAAAAADDEAAAQAFAGAAGIATVVRDFDALLATGVDFVVVGGAVARHRARVEAAAAQGAHALVLAPFAADHGDAAAMVAATTAAGTRLGVLVPELQDPVVDQLRRMIAGDWLGGIVAVQGMLGDDCALHGGDPTGLHPLITLGSRHVHLASWLTGRPVLQVTAQTTRMLRHHDDGAVATALFGGGVVGSFAVSRATRMRAFAVHGTDGGVRMAGDRVWLLGHRTFHGDLFDYTTPGQELAMSRSELAPALAARDGATELVGRFARWLDDCDDYPCPGDAAVDDCAVVAAMVRASTTGSREAVAPAR